MGHRSKSKPVTRTPIAHRVHDRGPRDLLAGVTRENLTGEILAGVTLLAIAIPEQLATSQLAGVAAFSAMIAFIGATLAFTLFGSNPIVSVGADSTIAPLFAVALLRLALPYSQQYFALVAITAVVTGVLVAGVGLLKLGWLGDFLSLPIVTGFMSGIGVIIIVHQLPHVLGVSAGGESVASRLASLSHQLGHASTWSLVIALGTLVVMVVGERVNARLPMALVAVLGFSALTSMLSLSHHGVQVLGTVVVGGPTWRMHWLSAHEWAGVVMTSITLAIVIMSQSAATSRVSADELAVADDLNRDFFGVGVANIVTGLCGSFPVDASPARTTVTRLAGGRTKLAGLVAAGGAIAISPIASWAQHIPLAALAGVLLFVAGRIIKVGQFRSIWRTSRTELVVALVSLAGVVVLGVEVGLAISVGLAILLQTWHSVRPRMIPLGRRHATTSWEPLSVASVHRVDHVLALLFNSSLYFANASVFRRELHEQLANQPDTQHIIIDAVAMTDLDYTGLVVFGEVLRDLYRDNITVSVARANDAVRARLAHSNDAALTRVQLYDSVDAAASALYPH